MLAFSPFLHSNLEWDNTPLPISSNHTNLDDDYNNNNNNNSNLKSDFLGPIFSPLFQVLEGDDHLELFQMSKFHQGEDHEVQFVHPAGVGLGLQESRKEQQKSASLGHESGHEYSALAKKLNHNARERDPRRRMNSSFSALRALLPAPLHQKEEFTIPEIISGVVDYIPQLQKEVKNLIHMKQELVSKVSSLHKASPEEEKETRSKRASLSAISVEKQGEREIVVNISTYERVSLPEVLQTLECHGLLVLNVSSSQCFGGRTFCNIHLWIEGGANNIVKCGSLNEELVGMLEKAAQASRSKPLLVNKKEPGSDMITFDPNPVPWIRQSQWLLSTPELEPPTRETPRFGLLY